MVLTYLPILKLFPPLKPVLNSLNLPNLNDYDNDENVTKNTKYYSINECNKLHLSQKSFSVYRTNIRSLSEYINALHTQLSMINIPFDIIGISETKHMLMLI